MKLAFFFFFIFIEVGVWKLEGSHVHHVLIVMGMVKTEQLTCHFHLLVYLANKNQIKGQIKMLYGKMIHRASSPGSFMGPSPRIPPGRRRMGRALFGLEPTKYQIQMTRKDQDTLLMICPPRSKSPMEKTLDLKSYGQDSSDRFEIGYGL